GSAGGAHHAGAKPRCRAGRAAPACALAPAPGAAQVLRRGVRAARGRRLRLARHIVRAALQALQAIDSVRCARGFDTAKKFLPDGLTQIGGFAFLGRADQCFVSQVQARTYAHMFGLLRLTGAAPERQALFLRLDTMMAVCMPGGYRFVPDPEVVAGVLHRRSAWSVLALTCLVDLFAQAHYRQSTVPDATLDPLWTEIFQFHLKEESRYAKPDELEWRREDAALSVGERDR